MFNDPDFRRGLAETIPILVPVVPFALVLGLAISESSMPNLVGLAGAPTIFAGAAHLTVVTLVGEGATLAAVILAGLVVNARHLMYSMALSPAFGPQPRWFRWIGPYFLVDQLFALSSVHLGDPPRSFRRYYMTSGLCFWITWNVSVALGLAIGPVIPQAWGLEFAVPLMFLGLLVMNLTTRPAVLAAAAGSVATLATTGLPNRAGILVGAAVGVAAGLAASRWQR